MKTGEINAIIYNIERIEELAEKYRNCYFWSSEGTTADERRRQEARDSVPLISWTEGGHEYSAEWTLRISCKNYYINAEYTRDGKKTTFTAIRNSKKRLEQLMNA